MNTQPGSAIILRGVAYHIEELTPIERIPALAADPKLLEAFRESGHKTYAHSNQSLAELAIASAQKTLVAANLSAGDINAVVIGTSEMREPKRYPEMLSTELLTALGLSNIPVTGVTLAGCGNYSSALRVARNMVIAEGLKHVLLVEADQVRGTMQRQVFDDGVAAVIFGDGAASVIVSSEVPPTPSTLSTISSAVSSLWKGTSARLPSCDVELVAIAQTVRPLDWATADVNLIAANNVIGFRHVLDEALKGAGAARSDIAKSFLSNISLRIVDELATLLELPLPTVYSANTSRTAHVWSCDNLINLADYCGAEKVPTGALFLMVSQAESYFSAIVCRKR